MGYLVLAVVSSALVSIIMRLSTDKVKGNVSMLAMNYLMCSALGATYAGLGELFPAADGLGATLGLGVVNGALYLGSFMLLQYNTKKNGVVLSSVFMKLGLLVPIVLSIVFYGEMPQIMQVVGFAMAIGAIVLINMGSGDEKMRMNWSLLLLLIGGGSAEAMSKVFEQAGHVGLSDQFLFYTFGVALLLCTALAAAKKERPGKAEALFGLLIGIPNFFSAKFLLAALGSVPAVIAYPSYSVATLLVITLAGVGAFKEKLEKRQWIGVGIILAALVLLNI